MKTSRVLAIDPGRTKCGIAVYDQEQGVVNQTIVETDQIADCVGTWVKDYACPIIVIGDRTAQTQVAQKMEQLLAENKIDRIIAIDEHRSTQEARARYWLIHPPRGWQRFIPRGLLIPPCAIDDFAAIILAERYFQKCTKNS